MNELKEKYTKEIHRLESRPDITHSAYLQGQRNMAKEILKDIDKRNIQTYYGGTNPLD